MAIEKTAESANEETLNHLRIAVGQMTRALSDVKADDRLAFCELAYCLEELAKVARLLAGPETQEETQES